jgi:hypothetical protein
MFLPNACNNPSDYTALLRQIMNIKWADKITNEELWRTTKQKPIEIQIKRIKWNWIGHTLHKEAGAMEKKPH